MIPLPTDPPIERTLIMMTTCKTIATKYHGPTNTRGSRISATATSGQRVSIGYDHSLSSEQNHMAAARALLTKLNWTGQWFAGATPDGYVFVTPSDMTLTIK